jgi:hypothetical protein
LHYQNFALLVTVRPTVWCSLGSRARRRPAGRPPLAEPVGVPVAASDEPAPPVQNPPHGSSPNHSCASLSADKFRSAKFTLHESTAKPELLPGISLRDSTASAAKTFSGSRGGNRRLPPPPAIISPNHGERVGVEERWEQWAAGGLTWDRAGRHHEVLQIPQAQRVAPRQ